MENLSDQITHELVPKDTSQVTDEFPVRIEKSNPLGDKLNQVRAKCAKLSQVLSEVNEPVLDKDIPPTLSIEETISRLESLSKTQNLSIEDYYSQSAEVIRSANALVRKTAQEQGELERLHYLHQSTLYYGIPNETQALDNITGVRRLTIPSKRRAIEKKRHDAEENIAALNPQIEAKKNLISKIQEQESEIIKVREKILLQTVKETAKEIFDSYEEISQEFTDGPYFSEIRNQYIDQHIAPAIRKVRPADAEKYISATKQFATAALEKKSNISEIRNKLYDMMGFESGLTDLRSEIINFVDYQSDKDMVYKLMADIAYKDLSALRQASHHFNSRYGIIDDLDSAIRNSVDPDSRHSSEDSFKGNLLRNLQTTPSDYIPQMKVWNTVKQVESVTAFFGGYIQETDEILEKLALEKSPTDRNGSYIDLLKHYPSEEAIIRLIVIATADTRNYDTKHANEGLTQLAKINDWTELLEETYVHHPKLRNANSVLANWDYEHNSTNTSLTEPTQAFLLDLIENSNSEENLIKLAYTSLTNESLAYLLQKKGLISQETSSSIIEAGAYIKGVREFYLDSKYKEGSIDDDSYRKTLRSFLVDAISSETQSVDPETLKSIENFKRLSDLIVENKGNFVSITYLTNFSIIKALQSPNFKFENSALDFGKEGSKSYLDRLTGKYNDMRSQLFKLTALVGTGRLSKERVMELPDVGMDVLNHESFTLTTEYPELFLSNNEGIDFFNKLQNNSLFGLDQSTNLNLGIRILELQSEGKLDIIRFLNDFGSMEIDRLEGISLNSPDTLLFNNFQTLFIYARSHAPSSSIPNPSPFTIDRVESYLENPPENKNQLLTLIRSEYLKYLETSDPKQISFQLLFISEALSRFGGAGNLTQLNTINETFKVLREIMKTETTEESTKRELFQGLRSLENRFDQEKWSNEDRTNFYNISRDIMNASPALFTDYLNLFSQLTPPQIRRFSSEIYPIYRMKFFIKEKPLEKRTNPNEKYDLPELLQTRKNIRDLTQNLKNENSFDLHRHKLYEEITNSFKERYGITKIPETLTLEHIRSLNNITLYMSNMSGRTPDKENILTFYLALLINDKWSDFKQGKNLDPNDYLTPERSEKIKGFLQERKHLNSITAQNLQVSEEEMPELIKLIDQESSIIVIGTIETIDIKLHNIIQNLNGLVDLDLYKEPIDKDRMSLLIKWGNKPLGSVVAKTYQQLSSPQRTKPLNTEEAQIQKEITDFFSKYQIPFEPAYVKQYFQDGLRPLSSITGLVSFVEQSRAQDEIRKFQKLLIPPAKVVEVFRKTGEDFTPTSGAYAVSQDLDYLDNLLVTHQKDIDPEDTKILKEYIDEIRTGLCNLEGTYKQIKDKFQKSRQNQNTQDQTVRQRIQEVGKIIDSKSTQQVITATLSSNLNDIIENIRACLACTSQGANNDTNLAFEKIGKSFFRSKTDTSGDSSVADEIVFLEQATHKDGAKTMTYVLDRVYGTNTPIILENNLSILIKKVALIKEQFPTAAISIFVPEEALFSSGISADLLIKNLEEKNVQGINQQLTIDVAQSAAGDHYIEFGGSARTAGKRVVSGVFIT